MREELIVRLRGAWQQTGPPDSELVGTALAPFGADLVGVMAVAPGDLRMLIVVPETADLIAVGSAVAGVLALPSPRITFEREISEVRGIAGRGYSCSCGGVDGDHTAECPRAAGT
ncbi:hypothetical protein GCM10017744_006190 [Streptomyces antimycoticus]|uniref:Uncharacterized protein n=1 Tax=Streptomyces antimycoticus TaxID=68175 RepID=A0A4D4KJ11_9ACTN|nr:hypothetical protein [Streptomyces antimycoticus]GDY48482.1 hypothetical protein SANT12839_093640 [Streptomyces antimycoticus]